MSTTDGVRYASADAVLLALDKDPDQVRSYLADRAKDRATSATQKWINRTGRPFHPVRVGAVDEPRSWEVHDVEDAISWSPATIILDNARPLPLDPAEGDALEVRNGRDGWDDITDEEGDTWTLDYRRKRLQIYQRHIAVSPYDDPNRRFCRLTYRYGPLGEDVSITTDNLVESVPADVSEAVAAKAATMLAMNDDANTGVPDDGQLTSRASKREALEGTWEDTIADYIGFSTV